MATKEDAKKIIGNIRSSYLDKSEDSWCRQNLSQALPIISEKLYSASTHFILELIQNADDNLYRSDVQPCLKFYYQEDGFLWIGSNEDGFDQSNVEAICSINGSTKKNEQSSIGEKGIGFKSVFKIASEVWISSGNFTFKFLRADKLGILAPIWCDFPHANRLSEQTMFCLRIPEPKDQKAVKSDLRKLTAETLLFLRKIRKIVVKIYNPNTTTFSYSVSHACHIETDDFSQRATLTSEDGEGKQHSEEILMFREVVRDMPLEPTRKSTHTTEVVLGFPEPFARRNRSVYSFLPVRAYGFPFLLQADFILNSSREDIDNNNDWNEFLLSAAIEVFLNTVKFFNSAKNSDSHYRYGWPKFLASTSDASGTIMEGFVKDVRDRLKLEKVIESQMAGEFCEPTSLHIVPAYFTDGGDPPTPLFNDESSLSMYASPSYIQSDLERLGISPLTAQLFRTILTAQSRILPSKSATWHTRLAAGIIKAGPQIFEDVKIIPLRNGRWISADEGGIYLPNVGDNVEIPEGLDVKVIDKNACHDSQRRNLFLLLGAKQLTESQICHRIIELHSSIKTWENPLTLQCMISHAWYLFSYGSNSLKYSALKLVAHDGKLRESAELYMDIPSASFPMAHYFPVGVGPCKFLHIDYLSYAQENGGPWTGWLKSALGIPVLPVLHQKGAKGISADFEFLINTQPSCVWLKLIRDNWAHYATALKLISVSQALRNTEVKCTNGRGIRLGDAYLMTATILQLPLATVYIPFVAVPEVEDPKWLELTRLGLKTKPDLRFYLTILRGIAEGTNNDHDLDLNVLRGLYKGIEDNFKEDPMTAKAAFTSENLVVDISEIKGSGRSRWFSLEKARWKAPALLYGVKPLSRDLVLCRRLFVEYLGVQNASAKDFLDELLVINDAGPDTVRIRKLLLALSKYTLNGSHLDHKFQRLAQKKLIPVRKSSEEEKLCAFVDCDWYIADRPRLSKCFEGTIWILDFNQKECQILKPLLERMDLMGRKLSLHVVEETTFEGNLARDLGFTKELQEKAYFISRLGASHNDRDQIQRIMDRIEVWSSNDLILHRYVTVNGRQTYGKKENGRAIIETTVDPERLFCSEKDLAERTPPWHFISEELSTFLEVPEKLKVHLHSILTSSNPDHILDILEKADIPKKDSLEISGQPQSPRISDGGSDAQEGESNDLDDHSETHPEQGSYTSENELDHDSKESTDEEGNRPNSYSNQLQNGSNRPVLERNNAESPSRSPEEASPIRQRHNFSPRANSQQAKLIDIESIVHAAKSRDLGNLSVLGPSAGESNMTTLVQTRQSSPRTVSTTRLRNSITPQQSPGRNAFDMSGLASALATAEPSHNTQNGSTSSEPIENEIGYRGELYVYELLRRKVEASPKCWTSRFASSRHGLPPFEGHERDFSDFTIDDQAISARVTNWFIENNYQAANHWIGSVPTFHLEVKTTLGACSEPFIMSNNQFKLARKWHTSPSDVYIIVRVYNLFSTPDFQLYIDPFALFLEGALWFEAQGGFRVQPI